MTGGGAPPVSFVVLAKDTHLAKTRLCLDRERARRVALQLAANVVDAAIGARSSDAVFVVTSAPRSDATPL